MGETVSRFQVGFNKSVKIEARPERITSEAGTLLAREAMETLGLLRFLDERLVDGRNQRQVTHPLSELVATSVLLKVQGLRDHDDADALRDDAAMRLSVSRRKGVDALGTREPQQRERNKNPQHPDGLASQPTLSRMVGMLSSADNREALRDGLLHTASRRIRQERRGRRIRYVTLDVDSLPVEVHGKQPGAQYNGHYGVRMFHPLVATIAETGDIVDARLRPGSVHTAHGALDFILPLVDKLERQVCQVASIRMDAGFPDDKLLCGLESRSIPYVARIKKNPVLDDMAAPYLLSDGGVASTEPDDIRFHELTYKAQNWADRRRVVLVTQRRDGELLRHHFFLITSWSTEQIQADSLLALYRQRGTAESRMGELMDVLDPSLCSCPRQKSHYRNNVPQTHYPPCDSFANNEVMLLLSLLGYQVMHTLRTMMQKATGDGWSIRRLRERVLRVGARILVHARRAVVVIERASIRYWEPLFRQLHKLQCAPPGS